MINLPAVKYGIVIAAAVLILPCARAQTLGGGSVYNFLKLPPAPQLSALGGITAAQPNADIHLAWHNPALLTPAMHQQLGANINFLYGGIKNIMAVYGLHDEKLNAGFYGGIHAVSYGSTTQTDAAGNITGSFKALDAVIQCGFSKQYNNNWRYGAAVKAILSSYGPYRSAGVAADAGVLYASNDSLFTAGLLVKNAGVQLSAYAGSRKDDLPFDLQMGVSKKLARAPVRLSLTLHHLHRFDIRYADTAFENEVSGEVKKGKFTFDKLFRHVVLAAQLYPTAQTELTLAFNALRRKELQLFNTGSGLTGFSAGAGLLFKKLDVRYALAWYQNTRPYHQLGLNIHLKEWYR